MFYFPIYWEFHHPNWLSYFSEGWPNHQPVIVFSQSAESLAMVDHDLGVSFTGHAAWCLRPPVSPPRLLLPWWNNKHFPNRQSPGGSWSAWTSGVWHISTYINNIAAATGEDHKEVDSSPIHSPWPLNTWIRQHVLGFIHIFIPAWVKSETKPKHLQTQMHHILWMEEHLPKGWSKP